MDSGLGAQPPNETDALHDGSFQVPQQVCADVLSNWVGGTAVPKLTRICCLQALGTGL
jgi:hypothetical protein